MKPFFGIDLTADKTNETENAREWMLRETDPALLQKYNDICAQGNTLMNRIPLPSLLRFLRQGGLFAAVVCFFGIFLAALQEELSFGDLYRSAPHYFWLGTAGLVLWAALSLAARKREKDMLEGEENTRLRRQLSETEAEILQLLEVPPEAKEADLLAFSYTQKNDTVFPTRPGLFVPVASRIFRREDGLYIATLQMLYRITADRFHPIRIVNKRIALTAWNKEAPPGADKSLPGKVWTDSLGRIWTKRYAILEWERDGEIWELPVPCYDLDTIAAIIGLQTEYASSQENS